MRGKWIYFAIASVSGLLSSLFSSVFIFLHIIFLLFIIRIQRLSYKQFFFLCLCFLAFFIRGELAERFNISKIASETNQFHILFLRDWDINGDLLTAEVKEVRAGEKLILRYKIKSMEEKRLLNERLSAGVGCSLKGSLAEPAVATNPNGFHYRNFLYHKQTYWILTADELSLQQCKKEDSSLVTFFQNLRSKGIDYLRTNFPSHTAPLAVALIFGDRGLIDESSLLAYERLGIVHLLAISGLHVGLLTGMLFYLGIRIGITRESMIHFLVVFLPCYAILAGAAPSVVRAVLMLVLVLAIRKYIPSILTQDVLSFVLILYILFTPYIIFHVGFQLSFVVTYFLILSTPILLKKEMHPMKTIFFTSVVCQLASVPILFYYFFEVSIISILANILYIPLFSVIILPSLLILFFLHLLFGSHVFILLTIINTLLGWLDDFGKVMADLPFAVLTLGRPHPIIVMLYIAAAILFFILWEKCEGKRKFIKYSFIPGFVVVIHYVSQVYTPYGEITFIDVGQGDSIFIKLPYNQGNYLIDTGGSLAFPLEVWQQRKKKFDPGAEIVMPFLKSKGVTTIDKLILTHGDADHIGGAEAIVKAFHVKEIVMPITAELSQLEKELMSIALEKGIPLRTIGAGESWGLREAQFVALMPIVAQAESKNDGSIVLFAKIGGFRWLFTGDLEKVGEEQFIKKYPHLTADILKVGHHGSKTSSTEAFLEHIQPSVGVISAGRKNRYGHPHSEVLDRLDQFDVMIYRTDLHGAITYKFSGKTGTFSAVLP